MIRLIQVCLFWLLRIFQAQGAIPRVVGADDIDSEEARDIRRYIMYMLYLHNEPYMFSCNNASTACAVLLSLKR